MCNEALPRFANRLHVFEGKREVRRARYLGFLSLRPRVQTTHGGFRYTAIAHITPPRFMLRPRYHLITAAIGAAEGVTPFRGVPFCVPNYDTGNLSACLHAAIHEALLLKVNHLGCTTINSQDMLSLIWTQNATDLKILYEDGANLNEAVQVLEHPDVRAGGLLEAISQPYNDLQGLRDTLHCMTDYLANGLPLIVPQVLPPLEPGEKPRYHSIFVFGMHLLRDPEERLLLAEQELSQVEKMLLPGRLIYHDVRVGPFMECSSGDLLNSAWIENKISFLAIAPRGAKMRISRVRDQTRNLIWYVSDEMRRRYLTQDGVSEPPPPQDCRIVIRLLQTEQVMRRYLMEKIGEKDSRLLTNAEQLLKEPLANQEYWWCAEVRPQRLTQNVSHHFPILVYIWPIQGTERDEPHACMMRRTDKDMEALFIPKQGDPVSYVFQGQSA